MNKEQKFTPKYWVVHNKLEDDVMIETASKTKFEAVDKFCNNNQLVYNTFGSTREDDIKILFYESDELDCILIEIKDVSFDN